MSNVAKLKKQAAEFELKRQFDKALAIYIKLLEQFDENAAELDVALFNRVGDLMMRHGNVADAVDYYEQAIDRYADTGFFNNAIALCNKVLRHSPGRASVYYKLGKISAQKGFKNDAKVNFLEYADRMQKAGKVDESFRALKEFADLSPDQDEIRLTLADQLIKANRKDEAIEQLQTLHEKYDSEGRATEAAATLSRMRHLDPKVEPRTATGGRRKTTSSDLIFIDLDSPSGSTGRLSTPAPRMPLLPPRPVSPPPPPPPEADDLPLSFITTPPEPTPALPIAAQLTPAEPIDTRFTPPQITPAQPSFGLPTPAQPTPAEPTASQRTPAPLTPIEGIQSQPTPAAATPAQPTPAQQTTAEATPAPPTPGLQRVAFSDKTSLITSAFDAPLADSALPDVDRLTDDSLGIVKSTPSASVIGLQATSLADDDTERGTPPSPLDIEPTSLQSEPDSVGKSPLDEEMPAIARAGTPAYSTPGGGLNLVRPQLPTPPAGHPSGDFDLSELSAGMHTPRQTPIQRGPLDGLPLMDLDISATPPSSASIQTSDLDLIDTSDEDDTPASSVELNFETMASDDDEPIELPTPSMARKSTLVAEHSVTILKATVEGEPDNWSLHRELAEAMLEAGDREGGIRELELAMNGAERSGDLDLASAIAEEIARLEPEVVKHHQKRVEYAFRTNDRSRLVEAYVALADALLRADHPERARTVYQRVLDLAPDDVRARAALDSIPAAEPEPPPPPPQTTGKRRVAIATPPRPTEKPVAEDRSSGTFVNLGDWLRDSQAPRDTRMVVQEQEPSGDEDADFADMLRKFKQGVAENVDPEDYQSHYDLAIAFKEMGLLDEAISEFQKALGSPANRLPTFESLGQCFLDKGQAKLATSILTRALGEKASEDQLIGVLYLLGRAAELQGSPTDAVTYYQRVFVLDIQFRDTADRLNELERATR